MLSGSIKLKFSPLKMLALLFLIFQSCNNNNTEVTTHSATDQTDTIQYNNITKPGSETINTFVKPQDAEKEERKRMILMQIDSTYSAISLLDEAKNELTSASPAELTAAERNKKSKAIFSINILQNELTRALDASILANLKLRTNELVLITAALEKNVGHLQSVTDKLNKATLCIGRLTNMLALGLSKGIIKPLTPKTASAADIKASLN
jgi:hypothetical protein